MPVVMRVKYEKVPHYCGVCGLLGHVHEECGSGVHSPRKLEYGKWMLANTSWNYAQLHPKMKGSTEQGPQVGVRHVLEWVG
jgi:hypothetical protein